MKDFWYANFKPQLIKEIEFSTSKQKPNTTYSYTKSGSDSFGCDLVSPCLEKNSYGALLCNGSIFDHNHNKSFNIDCFDNNIDSNIDIIKNLSGEYALCYVTDRYIIFATDHWGTKNLWCYFNRSKKQIMVSTDRNFLVKNCGSAWIAEDNKIYVLDKETFSIKKIINTEWDFTQKIGHYDYVFEAFENSVRERHEDFQTTYMLSSGYDSGVICCCAEKLFGKIDCVSSFTGRENNTVLSKRMKLHNTNVLKTKNETISIDIENMFDEYPFFLINSENGMHLTYLIKNHMLPKNKKVLIAGNGGDELYSNYEYSHHEGWFVVIKDHWPDQLDIVFPWHYGISDNLRPRLLRGEFITRYYGTEMRSPLIDQELFQAWLNTTNKLKNKTYKGWMAEYMKMNNYDYCHEKIGF